MVWNTKYKAIIYTAIFTTPFIGLFGITPIIMPIVMPHSGIEHSIHPMQIPFRQQNNLIPFLIVTLQVALIWLQNILLLIYGSLILSKIRLGSVIRFILSYCFSVILVMLVHTF